MAPEIDEAQDMEMVGYHDLNGRPAFKLALQRFGDRWILYTGHLWTSGWSVLDVTVPEAPQFVRFIPGPAGARTSQIQVAEGLMVTSLERPFYGETAMDPDIAGFLIWDVGSDPTDPRLVGHHRTGGHGCHRNFYSGGAHVYATVRSPVGFDGFILAVVDVSDPKDPTEVGKFWMPGQRLDAGAEDGPPVDYGLGLHGPAYVVGDRAYASWGNAGAAVLDVSDPASPRLISRIGLGALHGYLGCHSAVPYPDRQLMVINSECLFEGFDAPPQFVATVDLRDETKPTVMSVFPVPKPSPILSLPNYYHKGGRFGPHNQHHHQGHPDLYRPDDVLPITFFNAGLRLYSISDPYMPEEVGYFVPVAPTHRYGDRPATALVCHFEDVIVDRRGYIYSSDDNHGLFILRTPWLPIQEVG
jgi:hypothetical protein